MFNTGPFTLHLPTISEYGEDSIAVPLAKRCLHCHGGGCPECYGIGGTLTANGRAVLNTLRQFGVVCAGETAGAR